MIDRADLNGDGKISPDEFVNVMTKVRGPILLLLVLASCQMFVFLRPVCVVL